ncbi:MULTISPECIES: hypothetical protein [unclassified Aeromonas]|uniref:hypothetical protein n=1 Tax=unclassified Aeromonas TaxID=257493 RepID=UPI0022E0C539|nr:MULTISPECIES: hypothetical protein [unclassified Aeromonas]
MVVRVGFIVEGKTEAMVVNSDAFKQWLERQGLELCRSALDAKGGGNLLPHNIGDLVNTLAAHQPDHIVILTDLEDAPDVAAVRDRITTEYTNLIFIAVKAIEAWFLADTAALNSWLKKQGVIEPLPEQTPAMPWERLKAIAVEQNTRGPGSKASFAKQYIVHHKFDVSRAADHPACPSARAFCDGLLALAE